MTMNFDIGHKGPRNSKTSQARYSDVRTKSSSNADPTADHEAIEPCLHLPESSIDRYVTWLLSTIIMTTDRKAQFQSLLPHLVGGTWSSTSIALFKRIR